MVFKRKYVQKNSRKYTARIVNKSSCEERALCFGSAQQPRSEAGEKERRREEMLSVK
jgi:hypothetical protein